MGNKRPTDPSQNNVFEGGTTAFDDDAIEVKTGSSYSTITNPVADPVAACKDPSKTPTGYNDGISIKVKCNKSPHVVQFIYREIIGADGKPVSKTLRTTGGSYDTTTDTSKPNWNTDSSDARSPYYEAAGASRKDADSLTIFDEPSLMPGRGETWRATFKAYAICDGKVIREITWVREQTYGSSPTYTATAKKCSELPDWAKKQLKEQGYDAVP